MDVGFVGYTWGMEVMALATGGVGGNRGKEAVVLTYKRT